MPIIGIPAAMPAQFAPSFALILRPSSSPASPAAPHRAAFEPNDLFCGFAFFCRFSSWFLHRCGDAFASPELVSALLAAATLPEFAVSRISADAGVEALRVTARADG
jgi:hypothetical protein